MICNTSHLVIWYHNIVIILIRFIFLFLWLMFVHTLHDWICTCLWYLSLLLLHFFYEVHFIYSWFKNICGLYSSYHNQLIFRRRQYQRTSSLSPFSKAFIWWLGDMIFHSRHGFTFLIFFITNSELDEKFSLCDVRSDSRHQKKKNFIPINDIQDLILK